MANVKISQLAAAAALTGAEVVPVVQGSSTVKTTVQDIADLYGGGGGLGSIEINSDGAVGGATVSYAYAAIIPTTYAGGQESFPVEAIPAISLSGSGFYGEGGPFTATFIEFPTITVVQSFTISSSTSLTSVFAPILASISQYGQFNFSNIPNLAFLDFPNLISGDLGLSQNNSLVPLSLNFPSLVNCRFDINNGSGVTNINSASFPVISVATFNIYDSSMVSIDLPSVTEVGSFNFQTNYNLTTINLPNTVKINTTYLDFTLYGLVNLSIGTVGTLKSIGLGSSMYMSFSNCQLNQLSVDGLLTALASLDGTNGTTISNNGSLYLSGSNAAPSQVGLDARTVLQGRGWFVGTN